MVLRIIDATDAKVGTNIIVDGTPCTVKKMDISKTGKHGHAKVRMDAIGMFDDVKKVVVVPGHERFEVPSVDKKRGQVLGIGDKISVMDLDSFETIEMDCDKEIKDSLEINSNVEYWDIEGTKLIKRKV